MSCEGIQVGFLIHTIDKHKNPIIMYVPFQFNLFKVSEKKKHIETACIIMSIRPIAGKFLIWPEPEIVFPVKLKLDFCT
jgi:hypothetical protein